jgi:hypothetical protein
MYTVPSTSIIFKDSVEVVFCEGVQHCLQFCLSPQLRHNGGLQFYFQSGKQKKVRWVGDSHVVFGQNSLEKKEV